MTNLRKLEQFENVTLHDPFKHHNFVKEVKSLTKTIQDLGNPFAHKSQDCVLDTKHIVGEAVAKSVTKVEELGKKQFYDYVEKRLKQKTA